MKILMNADCVGGVWTYALELAGGLRARGHDLLLAICGAELTSDQRADLDALGIAWDARPYRLEWMADPWDDIAQAGSWLLQLAAQFDPDVVHLNDYSHAALPWQRPVVVVAHSDVVTWWQAVHGDLPPPAWERYRRSVKRGLAAADLVVAPTRAMLADLSAAYDMSRPTAVIHNGRSPSPGTAAKADIVAAVGRVWDEAKNIAAAARAAEPLPWPLVVAGEGDIPGVRTLGQLSGSQVRRLLDRAAIFVEPASYEPFGLAALEAGLAGCALVLGDIPSLREVWGDAATYVAPSDDSALRRELHTLMVDPALLAGRQAAARHRAASFTPAAAAAAYELRYAQLSHDAVTTAGAPR